ncbi:MAG: hypothetical protein WCO65_03295 [bacterium]
MKKRPQSNDLNKHIKELPNMQKLLHRRKVIHRYLRIFFSVVSIGIIVGIIFILRSSQMQIKTITVSGNEIINSSDVIADAKQSLSGSYLYLIPKTNIFFYPKNTVYNNLKKDFPRFDSIHMSLVNKTTLEIKVTEERGTALWCGQDVDIPDMTSQCYFTDTKGGVIDIAPYYSGNVYIRFFGGAISSDVTNPIGKTFIESDSYARLLNFAQNISSLGFQIQAVRITAGTDDFFILDLGDSHTAFVQFRKTDDYSTLYKNLQTAINKTDLSKNIEQNKKNLQYFDLRFTNKVYYKFNDGTMIHTSSSTATTSIKKLQ